jgi:hypothetical protein
MRAPRRILGKQHPDFDLRIELSWVVVIERGEGNIPLLALAETRELCTYNLNTRWESVAPPCPDSLHDTLRFLWIDNRPGDETNRRPRAEKPSDNENSASARRHTLKGIENVGPYYNGWWTINHGQGF